MGKILWENISGNLAGNGYQHGDYGKHRHNYDKYFYLKQIKECPACTQEELMGDSVQLAYCGFVVAQRTPVLAWVHFCMVGLPKIGSQ